MKKVGIFLIVFLMPNENVLRKLYEFPFGKDFLDILILATLIKWIVIKKDISFKHMLKTPITVPVILLIIWSYFGLWNGSLNFELNYPLSPGDPRLQAWKNLIMMPVIYLL